MRWGKGKAGIALLFSFVLLGNSPAGSLSSFEEAVAKPPKPSNSHPDYCDDDDESLFDALFGNCLSTVAEGVLVGTFKGVKWLVYDWWANPDEEPVSDEPGLIMESPHDAAYSSDEHDDSTVEGFRHQIGTAGMPYARFDYRWQYLDSDTDANDYLLEAGYKNVAFYGRFTQYKGAGDENLDIEQYYGMLRFGGSDDFYFPGSFQIGAGLGWYAIKGDQTQEGPALTIPVMLYPSDWFGLEFRPAWASINDKMVSDYDVSASLGHKFTHLRLGYRWLWVQGEGHWLNGPYAGVSVSF